MRPLPGEGFAVRPLDACTWPAFADLVERDGGIWGGCWCIAFHLDPNLPKWSGQCKPYRETKERLVREGRAQAAMVFDGEKAVGWCQFGPPHELRNIKHRREYEKGLTRSPSLGLPEATDLSLTNGGGHGLPDWRITCFYVGKGYRKRGVANLALSGALEEIARLGGGVVEAYPEDVEGRKTSSSFLYGGTVEMFEREGFQRLRRLGMHHWVVSRTLDATGLA